MANIIKGGFLAKYRNYIMSAVSIISAIGAYCIGDTDIFTMLQAVFTFGGIYFLCKPSETKGKQ